MLGLLGGLLGGGLMGGMMRRGGGGGGGGSSMPTYAARAPQSAPDAPEPQEPSGQTKAQDPQQQAPQQPPEQAMSQTAATEVAKGQPVQQQQQKSPVAGLLDDAPTSKPPPEPGDDRPPEAPMVANRTETPNPVARQQDEQMGQVPRLETPSLLGNQLLDSGTNRQRFEYQEGMPAKQLDTSGSDWTPPMGLSYQQPTTVAGSVPARKYRM